MYKCMVSMATHNVILINGGGGVPTKSSMSAVATYKYCISQDY